MRPEAIKQSFAEWRTKHSRLAWLPITSDTQTSTSWFGGIPVDSSTGQWPVCDECQTAMQFFLQLDLSALPSAFNAPQKIGVVQLFYCGSDDGMCETWAPFCGTHEIRLFSTGTEIHRPSGSSELPRKFITGWNEIEDAPHPEEHEAYGVSYNYDFKRQLVSVRCDDFRVSLENLNIDLNVAELVAVPKCGDKLGGWPFWVQGVEYPDCPDCNQQMELLMQIDSEDNLAYMFGDVGCAHLTQCRRHPNTLAFAWACG